MSCCVFFMLFCVLVVFLLWLVILIVVFWWWVFMFGVWRNWLVVGCLSVIISWCGWFCWGSGFSVRLLSCWRFMIVCLLGCVDGKSCCGCVLVFLRNMLVSCLVVFCYVLVWNCWCWSWRCLLMLVVGWLDVCGVVSWILFCWCKCKMKFCMMGIFVRLVVFSWCGLLVMVCGLICNVCCCWFCMVRVVFIGRCCWKFLVWWVGVGVWWLVVLVWWCWKWLLKVVWWLVWLIVCGLVWWCVCWGWWRVLLNCLFIVFVWFLFWESGCWCWSVLVNWLLRSFGFELL